MVSVELERFRASQAGKILLGKCPTPPPTIDPANNFTFNALCHHSSLSFVRKTTLFSLQDQAPISPMAGKLYSLVIVVIGVPSSPIGFVVVYNRLEIFRLGFVAAFFDMCQYLSGGLPLPYPIQPGCRQAGPKLVRSGRMVYTLIRAHGLQLGIEP